MAAIRIVDVWLRSPIAQPSYYRSVMVIAEKWAEQRVMMRAYAESRDQTLPTIMLQGFELAIGPAGIDVNGPWGIHVDGDQARAHEVKSQLELAAKRLAGSKGNPPRLQDEEDTFSREPTNNWAPGTPRILPRRTPVGEADVSYVAPPTASRVPQTPAALPIDAPNAQHYSATSPAGELRKTPGLGMRRRTRPTTRVGGSGAMGSIPANARTALGYQSGAGAQSAVVRLGLSPQVSARLGRLVDRVVPAEFHIDVAERRVLNALGEAEFLTARAIGNLLDIADAMTFMEELVRKLETFGLDLVEPGEFVGGEPTYRLRR